MVPNPEKSDVPHQPRSVLMHVDPSPTMKAYPKYQYQEPSLDSVPRFGNLLLVCATSWSLRLRLAKHLSGPSGTQVHSFAGCFGNVLGRIPNFISLVAVAVCQPCCPYIMQRHPVEIWENIIAFRHSESSKPIKA